MKRVLLPSLAKACPNSGVIQLGDLLKLTRCLTAGGIVSCDLKIFPDIEGYSKKHTWSYSRDNLDGRRTGPDNGYLLVFPAPVWIPPRRVKKFAFKIVKSFDVRPLPVTSPFVNANVSKSRVIVNLLQDSIAIQKHIAKVIIKCSLADVLNLNVPAIFCFRPRGSYYSMVEFDVLHAVPLDCTAFEIRENLRLFNITAMLLVSSMLIPAARS